MTRAVVLLCLSLYARAAFPQAATGAPSFEVASVKPNQAGNSGGGHSPRDSVRTSPGSLSMRNISLRNCIRWAYNTSEFQITGPGWLDSERFDILAKAPAAAADDQLKLMLQALLAERFQLALHREEKVMPIYELVVAKNGHKMHASESEGEPSMEGGGKGKPVVAVQRMPLAQVVELLSRGLRAPVLDKTGLPGKFDFTIDLGGYITKDMRPEDGPALAFTILQEQLGLKLEAKKSAVEMLVIDHLEKVPTEN